MAHKALSFGVTAVLIAIAAALFILGGITAYLFATSQIHPCF